MAGEVVVGSLFSWKDAAGNDNVLDVDVVMNATDKRSAKLTDHVVETGAVITDHVVIQPEELSLELVVSQTPVRASGFVSTLLPVTSEFQKLSEETYTLNVRPSQFQPGGFLLLSTGVRSAIGTLLSLGAAAATPKLQGSKVEKLSSTISTYTLQATGGPVDRVADVHDQLIAIMNQVLLVTVSFKGRLYKDYLLSEVELVRAAGQAGIGRFKVQARAFRTVTGTNVQLPDPSDFRALPKTNKGNKPPEEGDPGFIGPPKAPKSIAAKGADAADAYVNKIGELFGFGPTSN